MGTKLIANNKKAFHDFFISEMLETGIVLLGPEVKSLRAGRANLKDAYCRVSGNELFVYQMHISPYDFGNRENPDPLRTRKLLAHRHEIARLATVIGVILILTQLAPLRGKMEVRNPGKGLPVDWQ